jgi:hypothetical protein
MEPSITRTEQFSKALKSFSQNLRTMLAKRGTTSGDHTLSASEWDALFSEALQSAVVAEDVRERQATIVQIMKRADVSAKSSIADCLLFADDLGEAHHTIMMHDQQRQAA